MSDPIYNQRAQQILKLVIERYIQEGSPIGSRTLAEEYALGLSPATIRNILSDLEEHDYLVSPHTSSGRVPTERGYRFFVDTLLTVQPLQGQEVEKLKEQLDPDLTVSSLVQSASSLLSDITQLTGIVTIPRRDRIELRQVEFLPLSGNRVLVILVLNNREVQNRVIYTDRVYSQNELQEAANFLNTHFTGKELLEIRQELLAAIQHDREDMTRLIQAAIEVANQELTPNKDCIIAGQNNVLHYTPHADLERLRALFEMFTRKQDILNLLDHAVNAEGVQIFIGKESGFNVFEEFSVVTAPYSVDGKVVGSLGVIGPKRMPYDRVISTVDVTAKLLSAALNQG